MPFEDSFARALRDAADVSPSAGVEALAVGAAQRGRRRRRRNAIAASVAAVVLVTGGGAMAAQLAPTGAAKVVGPATDTRTPTAAPTPTTTASASAAPAAPVSDAQMLDMFKALLPGWQLTKPASRGTEFDPKFHQQSPYASFTVDDGKGVGTVEVSLHRSPTPVDMNADWALCPDKTYEPYTECTRTPRPDGSMLTVLQRYLHPDRKGGFKQWYAQLLLPDGNNISVTEWNMPGQTDYQVTRTDPPLDAARLGAIATDPAWTKVTAALVAPKSAGAVADPMTLNFSEPTLAQMLATAAPLLPAGLTEGDPGGDSHRAHFTVDDGHGRSLVEITVQDWSVFQQGHGSGADISTGFKDATVLPDGTRVLSYTDNAGGSRPGLVRNGVDILRPDHVRVLVHSFNAPSAAGEITRHAPALTLDQLEALATAPGWHGATT